MLIAVRVYCVTYCCDPQAHFGLCCTAIARSAPSGTAPLATSRGKCKAVTVCSEFADLDNPLFWWDSFADAA